jgi:hypothetical protein
MSSAHNTGASATASLVDVQLEKVEGDGDLNSYIVKLKEGVSRESVYSLLGPDSSITICDWHPEFFNGFAGKLMGLLHRACR